MELNLKRTLTCIILTVLTTLSTHAQTLCVIDGTPLPDSLLHVTIDEMLCGDAALLEGREGYDLILANITRNILLEDMPRYREVMLPGARLILSGFYEEDIPLLRARGEELGLTFVSSEVRQRWSRVELLLPA